MGGGSRLSLRQAYYLGNQIHGAVSILRDSTLQDSYVGEFMGFKIISRTTCRLPQLLRQPPLAVSAIREYARYLLRKKQTIKLFLKETPTIQIKRSGKPNRCKMWFAGLLLAMACRPSRVIVSWMSSALFGRLTFDTFSL